MRRSEKFKRTLRNWCLLLLFIYSLNYLHSKSIDVIQLLWVFAFSFPFVIIFSLIDSTSVSVTNSKLPLTILLALRLLSTFERKVLNIKRTLELRGINFSGFRGVFNYPKLVIPSIVVFMLWSEKLYESMLLRGAERGD